MVSSKIAPRGVLSVRVHEDVTSSPRGLYQHIAPHFSWVIDRTPEVLTEKFMPKPGCAVGASGWVVEGIIVWNYHFDSFMSDSINPSLAEIYEAV